MASVHALYQLQEVDLGIDQLTSQIQAIEQRLGDMTALANARQQEKQAREQVFRLKEQQRDLEQQVAAIESNIGKEMKALYGGSVKNSRELLVHEKQVQALQESKRKLEDQILDAMSLLDEAEQQHKQTVTELQALEKTQSSEHADLQKQLDDLNAKRGELQQKRDAMAAQIDISSMTIYNRLRSEKRGRAIATVQQNVCSGCRISLPARELTRARSSPGFSYCSSCGRILLITR